MCEEITRLKLEIQELNNRNIKLHEKLDSYIKLSQTKKYYGNNIDKNQLFDTEYRKSWHPLSKVWSLLT